METRLTLEEFIDYCSTRKKIKLSKNDIRRVAAARRSFERLMKTTTIYGVNTGVGKLVEKRIPPEEQEFFQEKIVLSHAAGVGEYLAPEEVRGMLFLLINMLRKGNSGVSLELLRRLVGLFNSGAAPAIPEKGSVGASGDLVPLAHLALVLIGKGKFLPGPPFWVPVYKLKAGESLPLINGTHFMTSLLAHSVYRAEILSRTADVCAAMGIEALTGNYKSFDEKLGQLRPHWGQMQTADNLRSLLQGGNRSPRILQDPYSLRCASQVHGVAKEEVARAKEVVEKEINSVTGNPIIYEDELCHGGNFHGQVLAHAADALCIALSVLASISERRVDRFFHAPALPMFLVKESGPNSGLMVAQYTAAALVSENKTLAHPASVDSIPVACGQEDIVSMGGWAVRKLREICRNTGYVLAIELLCAAQALDFCEIDPDSNIAKIHRLVRLRVSYLDSDRILAKDIETIFEFIYSGEFLKEVEVIMGGRSE